MELLSARGRALLIVNPAARRAARALPAVRSALAAAGQDVDEVHTRGPGQAAELAADAGEAVERVYVLGGDGTVMEVVGALAHTGRPVGILPGGTGNLVARSLGIPAHAPRAAAALAAGESRVIDLGVLDSGRRFAFSASAGVDARMIAETPAAAKRRFGIAAYVAYALRAALECRTFRLRVLVDGDAVEIEAAEAMVANVGQVLARPLRLGPGIRPDDGHLDLAVYAPTRTREAVALAWRLLRHRFDGTPHLVFRPGCSFRVECDPPQPYQADGEVVGTTPFEARVDPAAATLLVPARRD